MNKVDNYRVTLNSHHKELIDLLPLDTPLTVLLEPTNICNFKCTFCSSQNDKFKGQIQKGMMSYDTFTKIADSLFKFPSNIKKITFCKDGEPFANKHIVKMAQYIKDYYIAERVSTTCNGSLMHKFNFDEIVDAFDEIVISVEHVTNEKYKAVTQLNKEGLYDQVRDNVTKLYHAKLLNGSKIHIHAKIIDIDLTDEEKDKFVKDFESITDSINIDALQEWAGQDLNDTTMGKRVTTMKDGITPLLLEQNPICFELMAYMVITCNADVVSCGVNFLHSNKLGNIIKDGAVNIWNGKARLNMINNFINGTRDKYDMCKSCGWIKNIQPKNQLHQHRDKLKELYPQLDMICNNVPTKPVIKRGGYNTKGVH